MQDIEFTIQKGKLWMLQTRNGKRTAAAAVKIAVDMVKEKLITETQALLRIKPSDLDQLLHPVFDPNSNQERSYQGSACISGASSGKVVFKRRRCRTHESQRRKVILVRIETSPEDIGGMDAAVGILTARGGMTSHAVLLPAVGANAALAGAGEVQIDYKKRQMTIKGTVVKEHEWVSLNGSTGEVMLGQVKTIEPSLSGDFGTIMKWADKV
jgi:pyruvate,orthophosphate dikinase